MKTVLNGVIKNHLGVNVGFVMINQGKIIYKNLQGETVKTVEDLLVEPVNNSQIVLDSASAMKSVTANIARGQKAMHKAITEKTTVHRAMYRNDLGWVDFVWGMEGVLKLNGHTKGAVGLAHIFEARMRKNGLNYQQVVELLTNRIVDVIAKGSVEDGVGKQQVTNKKSNLALVYEGHFVQLTKDKGNNSYIVTAYERSIKN